MPKQGKTPKKKSKEKTPQKSGESEYPEMDQDEFNRLVQNAIEQSQAQLQQKHDGIYGYSFQEEIYCL